MNLAVFRHFGLRINHGKRQLFNFPTTNKTMKYAEKRLIGLVDFYKNVDFIYQFSVLMPNKCFMLLIM